MKGSLVALIWGEMAFVAFLLWLAAGFLRDRLRRRSEIQLRVLERFGSAAEFLAFLETDTGRAFRDALSGRRMMAVRQVLGGIQLGIVLIAVGGGLGIAGRATGDADLVVAAIVCATGGLGLLAAALVSRSLSVRWRVWDDPAGAR